MPLPHPRTTSWQPELAYSHLCCIQVPPLGGTAMPVRMLAYLLCPRKGPCGGKDTLVYITARSAPPPNSMEMPELGIVVHAFNTST